MTTPTSELVERVREGFVARNSGDVGVAARMQARDALDELAARLEKQRAKTQEWYDWAHSERLRANRAEYERDEAVLRLAKYERALREIRDYGEREFREGEYAYQFVILARRALDDESRGA